MALVNTYPGKRLVNGPLDLTWGIFSHFGRTRSTRSQWIENVKQNKIQSSSVECSTCLCLIGSQIMGFFSWGMILTGLFNNFISWWIVDVNECNSEHWSKILDIRVTSNKKFLSLLENSLFPANFFDGLLPSLNCDGIWITDEILDLATKSKTVGSLLVNKMVSDGLPMNKLIL